MIRIVYFASIREQLGLADEQLEAGNATCVEDVRKQLAARGELWAQVLGDTRVLIAVNQEMCSADTAVADGDEIAFFPPVTGG